ncbi:MAG: O-antigen ligase family protein [Clostridia bacterium]|nr:O-antigen ligase family protein [Clostridia bacterium]
MNYNEKSVRENKKVGLVGLVFIAFVMVMMLRQVSLIFFGLNPIASMLFALSFVVFFGAFFLHFVFEGKIKVINIYVTAIILIMALLLGSKFSAYLMSILPFLMSLLFLSMLFMDNAFVGQMEKIFKIYVIVSSISFILGMYMGKSYVDGELVYYTENPNQSAALLLCYFVNVYVYRFKKGEKSRNLKLFYDLLLLGLAYAAIKTESRTVIISMVIMIAFLFLSKLSRRTLKIIVITFLVLAFIFPIIMTGLIELVGPDFKVFGEGIETGREVVWRNALELISANVFGVHIGQDVPVHDLAYYGEGLKCHNVFLEISWKYSLVVSVMCLVLFYLTVQYVFKKASDGAIRLIAPIFCAMFWHMAYEATLFVGAFDYSFLFVAPIMMLLVNGIQKKSN